MSKPYKHVQAILPIEEVQEIERHIQKLKESGVETSKQDFIRETLLKEVRKDNDESV